MTDQANLHPAVAPVTGAIRNPSNPQHFMVVQNIEKPLRIWQGETLLAETTKALRVIEISTHVLEPRYYVPKTDLKAKLSSTEKSTHCPLKGDASYFALNGHELAWTYETFAFADVLSGHVSFWGPDIRTTEGA